MAGGSSPGCSSGGGGGLAARARARKDANATPLPSPLVPDSRTSRNSGPKFDDEVEHGAGEGGGGSARGGDGGGSAGSAQRFSFDWEEDDGGGMGFGAEGAEPCETATTAAEVAATMLLRSVDWFDLIWNSDLPVGRVSARGGRCFGDGSIDIVGEGLVELSASTQLHVRWHTKLSEVVFLFSVHRCMCVYVTRRGRLIGQILLQDIDHTSGNFF